MEPSQMMRLMVNNISFLNSQEKLKLIEYQMKSNKLVLKKSSKMSTTLPATSQLILH